MLLISRFISSKSTLLSTFQQFYLILLKSIQVFRNIYEYPLLLMIKINPTLLYLSYIFNFGF